MASDDIPPSADRIRVSSRSLLVGHIAHVWNPSCHCVCAFSPLTLGVCMDLLDGFFLSVPFPLFLTKSATITRARSVVSHSFCPTTTHVITTHMYAHRSTSRCPLVFGFSSALVVTYYCLISFLASLSYLFHWSCVSPRSRVIIRVFGSACVLPNCSPFPHLCFPTLDVLDEKRLKKEILYKCTLYPFRPLPPFYHPPYIFLPLASFFICDNSLLHCTVEQAVLLFMRTFFANENSFLSLHLSLSDSLARSYTWLTYPSSRITLVVLVLWKFKRAFEAHWWMRRMTTAFYCYRRNCFLRRSEGCEA